MNTHSRGRKEDLAGMVLWVLFLAFVLLIVMIGTFLPIAGLVGILVAVWFVYALWMHWVERKIARRAGRGLSIFTGMLSVLGAIAYIVIAHRAGDAELLGDAGKLALGGFVVLVVGLQVNTGD